MSTNQYDQNGYNPYRREPYPPRHGPKWQRWVYPCNHLPYPADRLRCEEFQQRPHYPIDWTAYTEKCEDYHDQTRIQECKEHRKMTESMDFSQHFDRCDTLPTELERKTCFTRRRLGKERIDWDKYEGDCYTFPDPHERPDCQNFRIDKEKEPINWDKYPFECKQHEIVSRRHECENYRDAKKQKMKNKPLLWEYWNLDCEDFPDKSRWDECKEYQNKKNEQSLNGGINNSRVNQVQPQFGGINFDW